MASGYTKKFALDVPDKHYSWRWRGIRKESKSDPRFPVRVICEAGKMLDEPKIIEPIAKDDLAFKLRQNASTSERRILNGMTALGFQHSVAMFGYVLDFYHPERRVAVEVDGPMHASRKQYDRRRDMVFRINGIKTYRIASGECYNEPERAVAKVSAWIGKS